mgnify:CR=1 FL=1
MIVVVSDTSPIRALAFLGQISLLETLFGTVVVPPAVAEELRNPARRGPGELPLDLSMHRFIEVRAPADRARVAQLENELDRGESEALVLAEEIGAQAVLMDESAGRTVAERMGLVPLGTVGILLRGKRAGLLTELRPFLDRLTQDLGFFITEPVRRWTLDQAGE